VILGLSHIGLTVSDLELSTKFYGRTFGFDVLSDAERKGEWVDKITGIPNFHSRVIYLSVGPHRHLELFGFNNPPVIPREEETGLRLGILYAALTGRGPGGTGGPETAGEEWPGLESALAEGPLPGRPAVILRDPDGLPLRIIAGDGGEGALDRGRPERLFYPAIIVNDLDRSITFYRDVLGLDLQDQGSGAAGGATRWAYLGAPTGLCLKLIQPLDSRVSPALPWVMQRVGLTHVAFGVSELNDFYRRLVEKEVRFNSPPQPIPVGPHQGGQVVYLNTPDQVTLEFIDSPLIQREVADLRNACSHQA